MDDEFKKLNDEYSFLQWYKIELRKILKQTEEKQHLIKKLIKKL